MVFGGILQLLVSDLSILIGRSRPVSLSETSSLMNFASLHCNEVLSNINTAFQLGLNFSIVYFQMKCLVLLSWRYNDDSDLNNRFSMSSAFSYCNQLGTHHRSPDSECKKL